MAAHFHVGEATINRWKNEFREFRESVIKGKDEFDSKNVEQALLKRCLGFTYVETTRELQADYDEILDEDSEGPLQTLVVTKKVTKHIVPDVLGIKFWLMNRNPDRWKESQEHYHILEDKEQLTEEELMTRLKSIAESPNGLDMKSINGGRN